MNKTVGIIGFGAFGKLLAELITPYRKVVVYDTKPHSAGLPKNASFGSLKKAAQCEIVILAVNLADLTSVCTGIAPHVNQQTTVLDVCSVKVKPADILTKTLKGNCKLLATHPLFGPQSIQESDFTNKNQIVWHELTNHSFEEAKKLLTEDLGLTLIRMSPEEHDKEMAWVHALTFFTGRTLLQMKPPKSVLATGYYKKLLDLVKLESQHSEALFMTIQRGNNYADIIRKEFLKTAEKLEITITKENI